MRTLVTVSMVLDWPEDELHELAAMFDKSVRESMAAGLTPVRVKHDLSSEQVEEILEEHLEFYGVSLTPRQEWSVA